MNTNKHFKVSAEFGNAPVTFETGKIARLADGAVTVQHGETIILVTAASSTKIREGQDFFPLTVEYKEKAAAAGKIPGGYFKREGRPSEKEILTCRMTDRPLRPLFPKGYLYDTQIITLLLSTDGENDPDILSINGASAALMVSDIPFNGPIGAVRIGRINGEFVLNPPNSQRELSDLDLVYVGTEKEVLMIEGSAKELSEDEFNSALDFAQEKIQITIALQKEMAAQVAKPKRDVKLFTVTNELVDIACNVAGDRIEGAIYHPSKVERQKAVQALKEEVGAKILEQFPETTPFEISTAFDGLQKKAFRKSILENEKRSDGRALDEVRALSGEIGLLARPHGSSLFTRGETQSLCTTTLASLDESQSLDAYTGGEEKKHFLLHYHFPPFSVGETGRMGGLNRREIGHGALAERSIFPVMPATGDFPYAVRITSEIMESNGSSSMASICAGTLSLMDAGVPLKAAVAGISVGLVTQRNEQNEIGRYMLLTDILGSEDHFGDMDFKLAGSRKGLTGFQLDLKLPGIPLKILKEGVANAQKSRLQVLDFMDTLIESPRQEISRFAPRIETTKIDPEKIGKLIGPGGKMIKEIQETTGAQLSIDDDGTVKIYSSDPDGMKEALRLVDEVCGEIIVGETYRGRVTGVKEFGCFVECKTGQEGLVHISELSDTRVNSVEDVARVGDEMLVKCIGIDDRGRVKLSRKAAMKNAESEENNTN